MQLTWYTIRALAAEWNASSDESLIGRSVLDVWSGARNELTLVLSGDRALRLGVDPQGRYAFLQGGPGKPRKNVTPLLSVLHGAEISRVQAADRDRVLDLHTTRGLLVRCLLFGPRANVLVGDGDGSVLDAFRTRIAADILPEPRAAPDPISPEELQARWPKGAQPVARALGRAAPLLDQWLAAEAVSRASLPVSDACLLDAEHFGTLYRAVESVRRDLERPRPVVYRSGRAPLAMSLIPLAHPPGEAQHFESVSEAAGAYTRGTLGERAFRAEYDPLLKRVEVAASRSRERLAAMMRQLDQPSRADRYEHWGHLLMAAGAGLTAGGDEVTLDDLFAGGEPITIPLDEALTGMENAQRYYDKARRTRRAREEAEARVAAVTREAAEHEEMLAEISIIQDRKGLKAFSQRHADAVADLSGRGEAGSREIPFRRYVLEGGYEVWVGRNARQNDLLTFRHARKHDLWMHARGVAGSHTVLRRPSRTVKPPVRILEAAASIAAFHSKARGSALVPVIVAERKHVRKPRKAAAGAVLVDREEVLIVPPGEPAEAAR